MQTPLTNRTPEPSLAAYATIPPTGTSRVHPEPGKSWLNAFELDRHRIIACTSFRRLEGKSQVFAPDFHDHFRTRFTHTIEVAHVARIIAKALGANESLAEVITLAHDLGHPPFGHAGEAALQHMMSDHGGFNHNAHSLRVVDYLEHPYPQFRGLNLSEATLAGLAAHATPYDKPDPQSLPPSIESQIVSLADRIAYNTHDIEDALGARMIELQQLANLSIWQSACHRSGVEKISQANIFALRRSVFDAILQNAIEDVVTTTLNQLHKANPNENTTFSPRVVMSSTMLQHFENLERFLQSNIYSHNEVVRVDKDGQEMVRRLFTFLCSEPKHLPPRFLTRIEDQGCHRVVCDYIAGMSNRFCKRQFEHLTA